MSSLLVRDPFLAAPFRLMDEILRAGSNGNRTTGFTPALEVRETADEYLVLVDLPGVTIDDVTIEVNDQVLTLSGVRMPVETGEVQLGERAYGSFARNLTLPRDVDSEAIAADYTDGVLTMRIPKPAEQKPKKITIGSGSHKTIEQ